MGTEFEARQKGPVISFTAPQKTLASGLDLFAHGIRREAHGKSFLSLSLARWLYTVAQFCYGTLD
jgi:hypothetical protein